MTNWKFWAPFFKHENNYEKVSRGGAIERYYKKRERMWIATIIGLFIAIIELFIAIFQIYQFNQNQIAESNANFEEYLGNIKSLQTELRMDVDLMSNAVSNRNFILANHTFHDMLLVENLRRSVSDGKIGQPVLKTWINTAYFDGIGLNNRILYVNSPEFDVLLLTNPNSTSYSGYHTAFENQTIDTMKGLIQPVSATWCNNLYGDNSFSCTLCLMNLYEKCLENNRKIEICNNATYSPYSC